ncbi:uncharacterized protein FIESC28_10295 [Fusarium coffeatum]|uniref:Aminoglycoside phosphotransferase domain-containing protein n=1 Tax=Fusarium coffeatum TaxID=231269 RepID=A0A366QTM3_9HYPO|nr:uncharacterized protein FIESC28_10295 [Fusarium coffeatum]RBR08261.1 hypothetical protein FIESC28_10295 [Fusarium coffeatum]
MATNNSQSPSGQTIFKTFHDSSFFRESRAPALPSPAEIRRLNEAAGDFRAFYRDRTNPVIIPELGLVVKYGTEVTLSELEAQLLVREKLGDKVPVPEVFAWAEDDEQGFIYMALIEGDTLQSRFKDMNEEERVGVCAELRLMTEAWRGLSQDASEPYVGSVGKRPVLDYYATTRRGAVGPYDGPDAVRDFHARCNIGIEERFHICFTHNDLCPPNILISKGPYPKVVGIIDYGQAGWYPSYWEYMKATRVGHLQEFFGTELYAEWVAKYLPMFLDPVADNISQAWGLFYIRSI